MSSFSSQTTPSSTTLSSTAPRREVLRGVSLGIVPLLALALLVTVTLIVTALVRQSFQNAGFFVWQQNALIALIAGMVLALLVYIVLLVLVIRTVARWQNNGLTLRRASTLWTLVITACIVLLPVLIAVLLPQSPAP